MVGGRQRVPQQVAPDDVPDDRRRREGGFRHRQDTPGVAGSALAVADHPGEGGADWVNVVLPMVSLLPEESLQRLRSRFGLKFNRLQGLEVQALVTADLEGSVSNRRLQEVSDEHPADLTKLLHHLVARGFLHQDGQKRWASYHLPLSERKDRGSIHSPEDSSHKADSSHKDVADSSHRLEELPPRNLPSSKPLRPQHLGHASVPKRHAVSSSNSATAGI